MCSNPVRRSTLSRISPVDNAPPPCVFVCALDFEAMGKELEEKRRDYLVRLNAAFHDMGTRLLSVPVAIYLALTKMQPLPATGEAFEALLLP
jgi:hypothetical protein